MTIDKEFESFLFSQDDGEMYSSAYRRAWQAARAIDAKRIAELELANQQAKEAIKILTDGKPLGEIVGIHTAQLQSIKIADLEAQNKAMREALSDITTQGNFQMNNDKSQLYVEVSKSSIKKAFKVLAKVKG